MGYFAYGAREVEHLCARDPAMGRLIERAGHLERPVAQDLFTALIYTIVGQQLSIKAADSIWRRLMEYLEQRETSDGFMPSDAGGVAGGYRSGHIEPEGILALPEDTLRAAGLSGRKTIYIREAASRVASGALDLVALESLSDAEITRRLTELPGIGTWSAEMLLIFGLSRPDVLSWGDIGIRRGIRLLHGLSDLSPEQFERYRELYAPYGSTASFYLWAAPAYINPNGEYRDNPLA